LVNGLLLIAFIWGSVYHFNIRKECIYPIKISKPTVIIIIILPLLFSFIAYVAGNQWYYYIVGLAAAIFLISHLVGAGIHKKGIYYHGTGIGNFVTKLARWEDMSDLKFDRTNNKLNSFKLKKTRIYIGYPGKYKNLDNIYELENFLYN